MILRFAFLFLTIFSLSMAPSAFGQDIEAPSISVDLSVDLKAFPELVSPEDIQVFLNDERLKTGKINADTLVNIPVSIGRQSLKVWVPGHGADQFSFETKPTTTGTLAVTLTPDIIGLANHSEDYKLSWVHGLGYNLVPTALPMELNFVDKSGDLIPVTHIMDAYLSLGYTLKDARSAADLFTITKPGIIALQDKTRFMQLVKSFNPERPPSVTIRARDAVTGLDYQAAAVVKLAPVKIDGQIMLGATVPDNITRAGAKVSIGGQRIETDSEGRFSIGGVPAGEVSISATIYDRQTPESGKKYTYKYRARDKFDLSGPAKVELTLERIQRGAQKGEVKLTSHSPAPEIKPLKSGLLTDTGSIDIKPHVRFKMINLTAISSVLLDNEKRQEAEKYCKELFERNWKVGQGYCSNVIVKHLSKPIDVYSNPSSATGAAEVLGQLQIRKEDVWFESKGDKFTAQIIPEYRLIDWGYAAFGYAVTLRDYENGHAAIALPDGDTLGWIDLATVLGDAAEKEDFNADDVLKESQTIGFSHLSSCGWSLGEKLVFLEGTDETSFSYREPTPHDLWSPYLNDDQQPPLGEHETITLDWTHAYSSDGKLRLKPNPGKEC